MNSFMPIQISLHTKCLLTHVTFEWLFSGMNSSMHIQMTFLWKNLSIIFTFEWLFSSMNSCWTFRRSFCEKVLSQKSLIKCLHVTSFNNSFLWECWNSKSWSSVSSISECDNDPSRSCSCLQDFDFLLNFSILHSSLESQL